MPNWEALKNVPIAPLREALVPVSLSPIIRVYPAYYKMHVVGAIPECYVRKQVFDRLIEAAKCLPEGISLVVLDAWRPIAVQQYLFDTLTNLLRREKLSLAEDERIAMARTLVSPPSDNPHNPSPHLTGGSVDVTLCDAEGRLLDMGTAFDEASPLSWSAAFEQDAHNAAGLVARDNRRLLFHAMSGAGFTNLPSEWWHYDFGNQLWALYSAQAQAVYGATAPDSIERLWQAKLAF